MLSVVIAFLILISFCAAWLAAFTEPSSACTPTAGCKRNEIQFPPSGGLEEIPGPNLLVVHHQQSYRC